MIIDLRKVSIYLDDLISIFFLSATACVLLARYSTTFRPFLDYGKNVPKKTWLHLNIPKRWFLHFYIGFFLQNLLTIIIFTVMDQYNLKPILVFLNNHTRQPDQQSLNSGVMVTILFFIQSLRRSLECIFIEKNNTKAMMQLSHYLVGILFYTAIGISAWIGSISSFIENQNNPFQISHTSGLIKSMNPAQNFFILVFFASSYAQYVCHKHLASLPKYTLPSKPKHSPLLFKLCACPHYFAEVIIYISVLFISYFDSNKLSLPLLTGLIWVIVNLTVAAEQSWLWYTRKFPEDASFWPEFKIIPYVY